MTTPEPVNKPGTERLPKPFLSTRLKEAKTGNALPLLKDGRMLHQPDWYLDHQCTYWDTDRDPLDIVLRRTEALLADLKPGIDAAIASARAIELADLRQTLDSVAVGSPRRRDLFLGLCALRRRIALANPLLDFDEIIAMNGHNGTDKFQISWHETHEYYPAVDNDGKLIYSRWDYIDRGWNAAQGLWECLPDGRNPRAPHGNYPYPHYNRVIQ